MCLYGCNVCHTKRCSCKGRGRKRNSWSHLNSLEPSLCNNVSLLLCKCNINNMFRFLFFSKFYSRLKKLCPSTVSIKSKDELLVKSGDGGHLYHSTLKLFRVTEQVSCGLYRCSDHPTDRSPVWWGITKVMLERILAWWARKAAQSLRCLPFKQEDVSSDPPENPAIPMLGKKRQGDSKDLLESQPSQIG